MIAATFVVASYLAGTFPTAALVGRRSGFDPTAAGSRNPGSTNSFRLGGRRAGALVLAGDALKGALPTGAGWLLGGRGLALACGLAAVVGHVVPVTRRFRGGKGVATGAGALVVLEPLAVAVGAVAFAGGLAAGRRAAVGSLAATVVVFAAVIVLGRPWWEVAGLAGLGVLIVVRHRDNLARMREDRTAPQ